MEPIYVLILVLIVSVSIIVAFKTGYKAGTKKASGTFVNEEQKPTLFDNIKEYITDTVTTFVKKGEIPDVEIKKVETVDGKWKEERKFF